MVVPEMLAGTVIFRLSTKVHATVQTDLHADRSKEKTCPEYLAVLAGYLVFVMLHPWDPKNNRLILGYYNEEEDGFVMH